MTPPAVLDVLPLMVEFVAFYLGTMWLLTGWRQEDNAVATMGLLLFSAWVVGFL